MGSYHRLRFGGALSLVKVKVEFPNLAAKLRGAQQRIYDVIAATIQTNRAFLFEIEGAYHGHQKWAPLKLRNGQILSDTGALRKSIAPRSKNGKPIRNTGSLVRYSGGIVQPTVIVGTSLAYAPVHENGATITPKNKPMLWIPLPAGKGATQFAKQLKSGKAAGGPIVVKHAGKTFLLAKKVTIPARPFGQKAWNDVDTKDVMNAIEHVLTEILS